MATPRIRTMITMDPATHEKCAATAKQRGMPLSRWLELWAREGLQYEIDCAKLNARLDELNLVLDAEAEAKALEPQGQVRGWYGTFETAAAGRFTRAESEMAAEAEAEASREARRRAETLAAAYRAKVGR